MIIKKTGEQAKAGINILLYGAAGAGKTSCIPTLPAPIVLSAEGGLLSIQDADLPYIEVADMATLREAYAWLLKSDEAKSYESIAIDSISEIGEVVLTSEKKGAKDPRQAYGAMGDAMADIIRSFRDLPGRHVLMTAKMEKAQDELGRISYAPSMPGNKLGQALPYWFDEVLALRVEKDKEGRAYRIIQASPDGAWSAKDRSGKLAQFVEPDLGEIIRVISGGLK